MRRAVRSVLQFQSLLQHQGDCLNGFARRPNRLVDYNRLYAYRPTIDVAIDRYSYPSFIISRALSIDAAQVNSEDVNRGGPLVEYERRIAAGELVDGDICQVVLKTLIVIHRALREVGPNFREALGEGYVLNLSHFRDDSSPEDT